MESTHEKADRQELIKSGNDYKNAPTSTSIGNIVRDDASTPVILYRFIVCTSWDPDDDVVIPLA